MCRSHAEMCNLQRSEESKNYWYKSTAKIRACLGKKSIYDKEQRISTFEGE